MAPRLALLEALRRLALKSMDGCFWRTALFVPNPNAKEPLTEDEIGALVGPAMRW